MQGEQLPLQSPARHSKSRVALKIQGKQPSPSQVLNFPCGPDILSRVPGSFTVSSWENSPQKILHRKLSTENSPPPHKPDLLGHRCQEPGDRASLWDPGILQGLGLETETEEILGYNFQLKGSCSGLRKDMPSAATTARRDGGGKVQ